MSLAGEPMLGVPCLEWGPGLELGSGRAGGSMSHGGGQGETLYIFRGCGAYTVSKAPNAHTKCRNGKTNQAAEGFLRKMPLEYQITDLFSETSTSDLEHKFSLTSALGPHLFPTSSISGHHGWLYTQKNRTTFAEILRQLKP